MADIYGVKMGAILTTYKGMPFCKILMDFFLISGCPCHITVFESYSLLGGTFFRKETTRACWRDSEMFVLGP